MSYLHDKLDDLDRRLRNIEVKLDNSDIRETRTLADRYYLRPNETSVSANKTPSVLRKIVGGIVERLRMRGPG
jgi:hypothetical protein